MKLRDLDSVFISLQESVSNLENPYVEELADLDGDPFRILIATLLSARTKDAVTAQASKRLFQKAENPRAMLELGEENIAGSIFPVGFYRVKARSIVSLSQKLVDEYHNRVPDTIEELVKLPGVGRKTANLVINLAFNKKGICVDTHVHRIVNRWGLVQSVSPAETEVLLREILPKKYWVPVNRLLVIYGQNICTPISPHCSTCTISEYCDKRGVGRKR